MDKTKIMVGSEEKRNVIVKINGKQIEHVEFIYPEVRLDSEERYKQEIMRGQRPQYKFIAPWIEVQFGKEKVSE